jgi:hypothetical protein
LSKNVAPEEGITAKDLEDKTKYSPSAVKKSLMVLCKEDKVIKLNPGRRPVRYAPNINRVH